MAFPIKHENDNAAVTAATGNNIPLDAAFFDGLTTLLDPITPKDGSWTDDKLANVPTETVKGRVAAGTGVPKNLSKTELTTLINVFTSLLGGAVPASGGGTTNFLRADGTWAAPPTSSGTSYAWYSTGIKTIKILATSDPAVLGSEWLTETSVGTYTIVVPAGEDLKDLSFLLTTAAGASQNAPSGAITIIVDNSANSLNDSLANGCVPSLKGVDQSAGDIKIAGTLGASSVTQNVSFGGSVMTATFGALGSAFADGSKILVKDLGSQ